MKGTKVTYTPAEIVSAAKDGIVVSADGVYDYNLEKFQEQVNADILEEQENIQLRITHLTPEDVGALPFDTPYAESTSPGGPANSAEKLNTDAGSSKKPVYFENGIPVEVDHSVNKDVPADAVFTDTKNTAGATDSELKLFLIGATELTENPQTHSQDSAYIGTDGCLYSGNKKVITDVSDKADKVNTVTNVEYNNKKFTKTINENTSDIVDINKIKEDLELSKSDIELENVTNDALVKRSEMGVANGVATLGSDGKVPSSLLPGYVDDVIELLDMTTTAPQNCSKGDFYYNTISKKLFEATLNNQWDDGIVPQTGKIYTNLNNNKTYRWGGSEMVVISETVAIGTTTGTAFDGKEGYDHVTNNDIHVTTQNKENWNNKYLKPNEGIPKSDLSNEVKEALDNANSALQEETDPTVPAWAKEPTKPSYDLDEVPDGANRKIPTKVSELENDSHFTDNLGTVTKVKIGTQEHTPTNGTVELPAYPTTLPASDVPNWAKEPNKPSYTLDEIPDGDTRKLANKVDKIAGKGLSTNDYTNDDKTKLGNIEAGAQVHIAPTTAEVKNALGTGNGTSKYLREDGNWVTPPDTTYNNATTSEAGLMSADDKSKLDGIESGALAHKTPTTLEVKNALGTGNGTTKYLREDGTWLVPPDTKYLSKVPEENGVDVSLVTTGDKYIWNHKLDNISDLSTIRSNATKGAEAKEDLTDYDAFVDLGLPSGTLWAKCNIGANKETEYGYYYQYGKGAALYAETLNQSNYTGTENPLSSEYDTAVQVLGGPWHMPTRVQMQELTANTTYQWVTNYKGSGINGGTFTATNGAVLFIPAAGSWDSGSQSNVGKYGSYWGSSPNDSNYAYGLDFGSSYEDVSNFSRKYGCSVRPVCETPPSKLLRKVDKVFGKDLSTNDYTNAEKSKLGGIEAGALVHKAPTSTEVKNALGTGSGTDKFLREDGTWQTPNYTDISYSNKKLTKTVNGSTSDVVSTDTLKSNMNLNKVGNFKAVSTEANLGLTDTEKGNARTNIGAGTSSLVIGTTSNTAADGKIVDDHIKNTSNPHSVTKELVGLGNVKNLSITVTSTSVSDGTNTFNKYVHPSGTNPHGTTKSDVGLGNVTNDAQVKRTEMGANNGVATLDNTGKVPSSQLPSFVDDVIEGYLDIDGQFYDNLAVLIGSLYWATMNVGATAVTDTGLYFQWGDVSGYTASQVGSGSGQKYFGWADYKYGNGTSSPSATDMTKYNATDGKTVLEAVDDAAVANWGGSWRIPTTAEFQALGNATTSTWTADYQGSGVAGLVLTDKTDSSKVLFFPAAGRCYNGSVYNVGSRGTYWSGSVYSYVQCAYDLSFYSSNASWQGLADRELGYAVRGVSSTAPTRFIPEVGKIYVDKATNKTYRWSGSAYTEISESLALGETSSTAYRGDRGKTAYTHASDANKLTTSKESGLYKIAVTNLGHVLAVTAVTKSDITSLGIPALDNSVKQEYVTGYTDWRNIILGLSHGSDEQYTPETITGLTYIVKDLSYKPDSGILRTKQFKSIVSTGTAPFIISSTTKVNNLNADLIDGYHHTKFMQLYSRTDIGTSPNFDNLKDVNGNQVNGFFEIRSSSETTGESGTKPFDVFAPALSILNSNTIFQLAGTNSYGWYIRGKQTSGVTGEGLAWQKLVTDNNYTSYTYSNTASRTANTVLAAPNGSAGAATFRSLVAADIPSLAISKITDLLSSLNGKLSLSGGTITGNILFSDTGSEDKTSWKGIGGTIGINDDWIIRGYLTANNGGCLEIATGDDGNEPIYVRQYSPGYARSQNPESANVKRTATLLDASGNTTFPGTLTATILNGNLAYTYLTGSGTTANQAIVSSGTANGWTLKTLGSRAFDSTSYLPLAGGTMTGKLTIKTDNFNNLLHLNRTSSSGTWGPAISFDYDDICNGTLTMASNELYIGDNGSTKYKALHEGNSSVSLSGSTLTVKINGNSLSLTNTWRGILNNLTSTSTTDSLSAAQGKALNEKFANYLLKVTKKGSTTKPVYVSADGTFAECNSYPTSLPASDVSAWAKAASKPSYSYSEISSRPTHWANIGLQTSANYITEPEVKSVKINGSSTNSASSSNCSILYDTTNKCLNFIFN